MYHLDYFSFIVSSHNLQTRSGVDQSPSGIGYLFGEHKSPSPSPSPHCRLENQ